MAATEKYVVSNTIVPADLAPWQGTTRIIRGADLYAEIAALKARNGRPILVQPTRQEISSVSVDSAPWHPSHP
jgi:hypothetical protein